MRTRDVIGRHDFEACRLLRPKRFNLFDNRKGRDPAGSRPLVSY